MRTDANWRVIPQVISLAIAMAGSTLAAEDARPSLARWSFEEIEAGVTADDSGRLPGRLYGQPISEEGPHGRWLQFDGVRDFVRVPDSAALDFSDATFSILSRVRVDALHAGHQMIAAKNVYAADQREWGLKVDDDNRFRFYFRQDGWQTLGSQTVPRAGHWHHVAVTVDRGQARLYVDGRLEGEALLGTGLARTPAPLTIGGVDNDGRLMQMFYGAIDYLALARRALSAEEVRTLAAEPQPEPAPPRSLLPADWDPRQAADQVLERLICVTAPNVRGAHDAEMLLQDDHAYIVSTVNDERPGHSARDSEYVALSIVHLETGEVEVASLPIARSEQQFANETLPVGQCWVPRIIRLNERTLRVFFISQKRGVHCQVWYRDFDLRERAFQDRIERARLRTSAGTFPMQPAHFHADAVAHGFERPLADHGLYVFDSFKTYEGVTYVAINSFPGRQNALATLNEARDTFRILGHINEPQELALSEASVERLPDGAWGAILRSEGGSRNYAFSQSADGRQWAPAESRGFVRNGTNAKPTFNRFGDVYYLGWQDAARIDGVRRSVFNVDISRDTRVWERKYLFETADAFEYPTFREHRGAIWLTISGRNQRTILFGKLEPAPDQAPGD